MNFPPGNKVFQRPCHSVLFYYHGSCFATTEVNYYDRSICSMAGSLGIGVSSERVFLFVDCVGVSRNSYVRVPDILRGVRQIPARPKLLQKTLYKENVL